MKLGKFTLENGLILPPIAGFSDVGMRMLACRFGAELTFTEMVSAKGLVYGSEGSRDLLATTDEEKIKAVQIFGGEEPFIQKAILLPELAKFDVIDLNFGCPVPKIVKNGEGSALMRDPDRIYSIIKSAVEVSEGRLITAKIRAGFTYNDKNAVEVAKAIQSAGGSMITVHGRTRDMFYSGKADLDIIKKVKEAVSVPVVGNGDVTDRASFLHMKEYTGCDGVAIARGALGRPYIFAEVLGKEPEYDLKTLISEHIGELIKYLPEKVVVNNMKKQISFYVKGLRGGKNIKENVFHAQTIDELLSNF